MYGNVPDSSATTVQFGSISDALTDKIITQLVGARYIRFLHSKPGSPTAPSTLFERSVLNTAH